jgi:3-hydroxybutyryl-CoA dehydrogenase
MKVVEIIPSEKTSSEATERAVQFVSSLNRKVGIIAKDSPGFIFNRILVPMMNEAFYLLEQYPDNAFEIDATIKGYDILPMGPFELADLIGLDIIYSVSQVIYHGLDDNPAYLPPSKLKEYVDNKRFGIKNMRGVYHYELNALGNPAAVVNRDRDVKFDSTKIADGLSIFAILINESMKVLDAKVAKCREDVNRAIQIGGSWSKGPFDLIPFFTAEKIRLTLRHLLEASKGQARYCACESLLKEN